jgi:hypothetical protein
MEGDFGCQLRKVDAVSLLTPQSRVQRVLRHGAFPAPVVAENRSPPSRRQK